VVVSEIGKALGDIDVAGPLHLAADRERLAKERLGFLILALLVQILRQLADGAGDFGMVG
jgi:hypothetical protein